MRQWASGAFTAGAVSLLVVAVTQNRISVGLLALALLAVAIVLTVQGQRKIAIKVLPIITTDTVLGQYDLVNVIRAQLEVSTKTEPLVNCRVRLLDWREFYSGLWFKRFDGQSHFVRWNGKQPDEETCEVKSSHRADVGHANFTWPRAYVPGTRPSVSGDITVTTRQQGTYSVNDSTLQEFTLEVTADRAQTIRRRFALSFSSDTPRFVEISMP